MTGEQLRAEVIAYLGAEHPGMKWFHSFDPLADRMPGWPDLFICGPGGALFAECKGQGEELSPSQARWKWALLAAGQTWYLWRPRDWWHGVVKAEIGAIA